MSLADLEENFEGATRKIKHKNFVRAVEETEVEDWDDEVGESSGTLTSH
jgi:hypothetical protein